MSASIIHVFEKFTTKRDFTRWVEEQAREIRSLAFENRDVIDKKSLEREIELFSSLVKAWKPMKALRRQSKDYDILVQIDKYGYHDIVITFPIKEHDIDKAVEYRQKQLKRYGSICCKLDEYVYITYKKTLDKLLPFADRGLDVGTGRYESYRGNRLVRKTYVTLFR